ncbi:hypothetical protein [Acinetobacter sp. YH01009]|uniref:hypothetical protein n=1 Tax=Acinetobacter sp. YH01009 TaxID=2601025 RepID=UPI0015D28B4B|nr:hypothetical protein [Acinetobacter sp. YH01009]
MTSTNRFFTDWAKQLSVFTETNNHLNSFTLYDVLDDSELSSSINTVTLLPYDHDASFMAIDLKDWSLIESKIQFPTHFDLSQLLSTFWESQPIVVLTDLATADLYESSLLDDRLRTLQFAYSRDLSSDHAPEETHYLNQSFDLNKLAHFGIYLQGHCYTADKFVITPNTLPKNTAYIIPVFNIHSMDTSEVQQLIVFDEKGKFLDCVVGTGLIR